MGDVLTFTPRPKPAAPETLKSLAGGSLRASLEEAAQVALDAADRIIAVLDRLDGDPDLEDGADAEPSLAAPENHTGSQVVWMRGGDQDLEEVVAEVAPIFHPEEGIKDTPHPFVLPWNGNGNVVTACGAALLNLVGG